MRLKTIAAAVLVICGCKRDARPTTNADYVIKYSCSTDGEIHVSRSTVIVVDGEEKLIEGSKTPYVTFKCPIGDVYVDATEASIILYGKTGDGK